MPEQTWACQQWSRYLLYQEWDDALCSALAHRQKKEHHTDTEWGNSSSHLIMAATDASDNFRSLPFYTEYPHVGTLISGNTHFSNSSTTNGQEISSDHQSLYISPVTLSLEVFWSGHWTIWGVIFLSTAKITLLESDQISSSSKRQLNDISFPRAVSRSS